MQYVPLAGGPNSLLLELTEKATQKYLMMSDNDFGTMIEDLIIVTNGRLKIENVNSQQYTVSEVMNQGYFAYVDEDSKEATDPVLNHIKTNSGGLASQAAIHKPNYYHNLKLLPKHNNSKMTLTHQLSQATAGGAFRGLQKTQQMKSLKHTLFPVTGEEQMNGDLGGDQGEEQNENQMALE